MLAFIVGLFPFINDIISWWSGIEAADAAAQTAENSAVTGHASDGQVSVEEAQSAQQQLAALDQVRHQLDNPIPVVVVATEETK